ncbi:galactokinase [Streptomyces virginiae]|uniref:galactokinase n=1 Tax=Streptomyces virginiae TaxID=1961 RepID=UPI00225011FA|nr:galactokinase [Streptomyces virginiae]MCX5276427.1 galactokinase [Streptomyces virginiae]
MKEAFRRIYGAYPDGVWAAPGRVNLIGEHTDYNDGFALPIAIPQHTLVAARRRQDGRLRLHSAQGDGPVIDLHVERLTPGAVTTWGAYPAGVVWALREAGHRPGGADLHIDSTVPTGAGLSSSAALECAVAFAYNDLYGLNLSAPALALIGQRAENGFAGVPCGAMDQLASACCAAGSALHLDIRAGAHEQVPFAPETQGMSLLVVDTRVKHDLGDGAYAALRAGCEQAARLLGLVALRDLTPADLHGAAAVLPAHLVPLVRHVVTENARVTDAVVRLRAGHLAALGPILTAGHASLRDDFRISCPESDLVVDTALAYGALGARMTGGGFGGSVIVLAEEDRVEAIGAAVTTAFRTAGYQAPHLFPVSPAVGARRIV